MEKEREGGERSEGEGDPTKVKEKWVQQEESKSSGVCLGFFCQPGVLSPTDRIITIQGERQLPSCPWANNEENQDTFLSLVMAPARVEVAGWLSRRFSPCFAHIGSGHPFPWCTSEGSSGTPVLEMPSSHLGIQLHCNFAWSFARPDLCSSIYHRGCAALLENCRDSLNTINDSYWPQPREGHLLLCHFAFHGINQHWGILRK